MYIDLIIWTLNLKEKREIVDYKLVFVLWIIIHRHKTVWNL